MKLAAKRNCRVFEKRRRADGLGPVPAVYGPDYRRIESLVEVSDDIVEVFDADTEPDHLGSHPGVALFFNRHLTMSGRGRMASQRFGVSNIHKPLDQLERIIELFAGLEPSLDSKSHQRTGTAAEVFLRQRVIRIFRESRIVDPLDPGMLAQEFGYAPAVLHVTLYPQRDCFDALQQQERAEG